MAASSSPPGHPELAAWKRFSPLTIEFRSAILVSLRDPSERVRRAAIQALATADVEILSQPIGSQRFRIPPALAERLQQHLATDEAGHVRSWIVNFFGRGGQDHDPRTLTVARSVLIAALQESNEYVVQFAASAMVEWKLAEGLPLLIKQLAHDSYIARMGVAQGLHGYRVAARGYLPEIEAAAQRETHEQTRKTLESAIRIIRGGLTLV